MREATQSTTPAAAVAVTRLGARGTAESPPSIDATITASGLNRGLTAREHAELLAIADHRPLHRGKVLFRAGDVPACVYIIARGCIKTTTFLPDGREQVNGLHIPGAFLGLDALGGSASVVEARASVESDVVQIQGGSLAALARTVPELQRNVHRAMSHAILAQHRMMWLLSFGCARTRVGLLLRSLVESVAPHGSAYVPATRADIASLLNIRPETYSRELSRLCAAGAVRISRRAHHIEYADLAKLTELCPTELTQYPVLHGAAPELAAKPPHRSQPVTPEAATIN